MAGWFARLFGVSPFRPLIEHQQKVRECVQLVPELLDAVLAGQESKIVETAKRISICEYEADEIKNRVRDQLPSRLFLPVSRADLLEVLSAQDSVADAAEDLGVLLTMRQMDQPPAEVGELLLELQNRVLTVVDRATDVVDQLETLANVSFAGAKARRVLRMIDEVDREEHLADKVQDQLAKAFFRHEDDFKPAAIYVWMKVFNKLGDLANHSEKMTHRIRLFLAG